MPVFRAYDLGCEFDASHVQQMYGADMRVRVRDHDGRPALDADGSELRLRQRVGGGAGDHVDARARRPGCSRLDACTGDVEWTSLAADEQVRAAVPGLLYDDFSGALATAWTAHLLDPAETRAAGWHLTGGTLRPGRRDRRRDGVRRPQDVDVADVAVETVGVGRTPAASGWSSAGRATGDLYRFCDHTRAAAARPRDRRVGARVVVGARRLRARRPDPARGAGRGGAHPLPGR